jgi:hypothetical protein
MMKLVNACGQDPSVLTLVTEHHRREEEPQGSVDD